MSRPIVFALLVACALGACRKETPPPATPAPAAPEADPQTVAAQQMPANDADNMLNLLYGATLVSRGGEADLANSAVHTMDGFNDTGWTSAPGMAEETLVYSMLAPTRIASVGVTTDEGPDVLGRVAFDTSMDGKRWSGLVTMKVEGTTTRQTIGVKPAVAQYVRVRTLDAKKNRARLRGVHVLGEEVAPPRTPSFGGCWTINGAQARLEQNGARITGTIATEPPTYLDGGTDNRAGMVMWTQGPMSGYAVLTRSPDGKHISGLTFYAEPELYSIGEGWFGERCTSGVRQRELPLPKAATDVAALHKRYALFGVIFDPNERLIEELSAPALDAAASRIAAAPQRVRIVARELRFDTPAENRRRAQARLAAIRAALQRRGVDVTRIDFATAGAEDYKLILRSSLQRALASRIDLLSGT